MEVFHGDSPMLRNDTTERRILVQVLAGTMD